MKNRADRPLASLGRRTTATASVTDDPDELDARLPKPKPTRSNAATLARSSKSGNWITVVDSDIRDLMHVAQAAATHGQLSPWELDFLASVEAWADRNGGLTLKQYVTLEKIAGRL
jgi:hypothetical protein